MHKRIIYNKEGSPLTADVTTPTITIYFPPKNLANRTSILICPDGGYVTLAIPSEGTEVAKWLNTLGITAMVLKYRLPNDAIMKNKSIGPLEDAQEAMRIIRRHSKEWKINPYKIGVMGFSAGGHVVSTLCTHYSMNIHKSDTTSAKPDFSVLVYHVISMKKEITHMGSKKSLLGKNPVSTFVNQFSNELHVDKNTPPAFLVQAENDKSVPLQNSIDYFLALNKIILLRLNTNIFSECLSWKVTFEEIN